MAKKRDSLARIATALERLAGDSQPGQLPDLTQHRTFVWQGERQSLQPVAQINPLPLSLLVGIDSARDQLLENTRRFALGFAAHHALLWGARGTGKSSLVKAVYGELANLADAPAPLVLVEIERSDIHSLPALIAQLEPLAARLLIFCDDLSFEADDQRYKALKVVLDGGLRGRPHSLLFYATSNRRHLLPRDRAEQSEGDGLRPGEVVEEKLSLSDRFGLWLGFHKTDQDAYLEMIARYLAHYDIQLDEAQWRARAIEWAAIRGARSGRVAWQFVTELAGAQGRALD